MTTIRLGDVAHARSGDKGSGANIGVIARSSAAFAFLQRELTEKRVFDFFAPLGPTACRRFLLPNLEAMNFVLSGVLAGGGSRSLRTDSQGKALGQAILELTLPADEQMATSLTQEAK